MPIYSVVGGSVIPCRSSGAAARAVVSATGALGYIILLHFLTCRLPQLLLLLLLLLGIPPPSPVALGAAAEWVMLSITKIAAAIYTTAEFVTSTTPLLTMRVTRSLLSLVCHSCICATQ